MHQLFDCTFSSLMKFSPGNKDAAYKAEFMEYLNSQFDSAVTEVNIDYILSGWTFCYTQ